MFMDLENNVLFLKTQKCAGTSVEIYLRQFTSDHTIGTRDDKEAQSLADSIGAKMPHPENVPLRALSPLQLLDKARHPSLATALSPHQSAKSLRQWLGRKRFRNMRKLSIVRHPYDRCVSWFFHSEQKAIRIQKLDKVGLASHFERFLVLGLPKLKKISREVTHIDGTPMPTDWIRFESIAEDTELIARELFPRVDRGKEGLTGLRQIRTKSHFRPRDDSTTAWLVASGNSAAQIRQMFHWEFEYFGYSDRIPESSP